MAIRVKTKWHKGDKQRDPKQLGSALAVTVWRASYDSLNNLFKKEYAIQSREHAFFMLAEYIAFLVHYIDRIAYDMVDDEMRAGVIQEMALRLTDYMEAEVAGQEGDKEVRDSFIRRMNDRLANYATFEYDGDKPEYACLRYFALKLMEVMEKQDQLWIIDQMIEIEIPDLLKLVRKTVNGMLITDDEGGEASGHA